MSKNIHQDLYARFGVAFDVQKLKGAFEAFLKDLLITELDFLVTPGIYQDADHFTAVKDRVIRRVCRSILVDVNHYDDYRYGFRWFLEREFSNCNGGMNECLLRTQILLDILFDQDESTKEAAISIVAELDEYFSDFPALGVMVKTYKTKAPQVFPVTSQKFSEEVSSTLNILDSDARYKHILTQYEDGLKEFLTAKNQGDYKDVIEDMYTACDELVKVVLGNKNSGFKHMCDKENATKLGLNSHQKELFKNLRNWVDEIKHGTLKDFDRNDAEMIITMTGSLIRFVLTKNS